MRQQLPKDGARYRCSFGFVLYEDWRCDNDATEALHPDDMPEIPKNVVVHALAMCERHLQFLGR
jgi:hypothetical protein